MEQRGRFAPSPTGELHLGNARTALLSWLWSRSLGGSYAMRVEDIDRPRVRPLLAEQQLEELRWLGLDWDDGPHYQSARAPLYDEAIERLRASGLVYPCFCSRAEIAAASRAPHGPADDGPRYPGTCRELTAAEVARRSGTRPPAWRLRVEPGAVCFDDAVRGPCRFEPAVATGDFVVMRADGVAAYQLAVVVDDGAMGITEVVRGDDLLPSTARQLLLYAALGLPAPRFAHVPLVVGEDGERLAKRHRALSLSELREAGVAPGAVVGLLAASCGLAPAGTRCGAEELVEGFDWDRVRPGPAQLPPALLAGLLPGG